MKSPHDHRPPKWPLKCMRFFVKKEYLEEIEGDMEELFYENVEQLSYRQARKIYTWEILRLLRPVLIKNLAGIRILNQHGMLKNYFKVSLRGLMKNPLNSSINIFGLAAAIGFCMLVYGFARWTISTDQFHEHKNEVYLATFFANRDGAQQQYGLTPRPLGEMLKQDFANINKVCRVDDRHVVVKFKDNVFHENVRYTDPEFLEMFTFPMKWGNAGSLADVNSVILSETIAIKYFGDEDPVGESIVIKFDKHSEKTFKVTGVAAPFPEAHTIDFDFLINFENFRTTEAGYNFQDWTAFVNATFIQVNDPGDLKAIEKGMIKYKALQNKAAKEDWAIRSFAFEPLATLNIASEVIKDDISWSTDDNYHSIMFLSIVGVFMLALACFNYINIAIVSAAKRLKEIGVRKSIGATRRVVIVQFLTENIVIMFFALIAGLAFGAFVVIPWFERMNNFSMGFTLNDTNLLIYLPAILLFTGIASGAYPAFYISKFHVVGILKGSVKFGQKNPITKFFLGFQLILACVFITSAVMFTQNSSYLANRSWGYSPAETLYAILPDQASYEELHAGMMQDPNVVSLSGSSHHLGKKNATAILHVADREYEVEQLAVDAKYVETMGLQLTAGRGFNDHEGSDRQAVIVNQLLVKNMVWSQPIGQVFKIDSIQYEVVGVVKDFHHHSFYNPVKPAIFSVAPKEDFRYLTIKVRPGSESLTYKKLQSKWLELFPEIPFDGGHQEDVWGGYFNQIGNHGRVWRGIAVIALLVAGLGLYGLMKLNVEGRVREFSIRKVLGAGVGNIASSITNQYLLLFIAALTIGAPVSYMLIKLLFDFAYAYHMPVDFSGATIAVVILISVLLLTVFTQIRKVVKDNPVKGLKVE